MQNALGTGRCEGLSIEAIRSITSTLGYGAESTAVHSSPQQFTRTVHHPQASFHSLPNPERCIHVQYSRNREFLPDGVLFHHVLQYASFRGISSREMSLWAMYPLTPRSPRPPTRPTPPNSSQPPPGRLAPPFQDGRGWHGRAEEPALAPRDGSWFLVFALIPV